ncbi:MAG: GIY-YIG nuclease family protein [Patescibacteria group bacterium]
MLKSVLFARYYIGITANQKERLDKHNASEVRSTKAYSPWRLVYKEGFSERTSARKREIFLKRTARARKELFERIEKMPPSSSLA